MDKDLHNYSSYNAPPIALNLLLIDEAKQAGSTYRHNYKTYEVIYSVTSALNKTKQELNKNWLEKMLKIKQQL